MNFYRNHFKDDLTARCGRGDQLARLSMWILIAEAGREDRWQDRSRS